MGKNGKMGETGRITREKERYGKEKMNKKQWEKSEKELEEKRKDIMKDCSFHKEMINSNLI